MSAAGASMFARYAYPPNALGHCGPAGAADLLSVPVEEIVRRAREFDGAWVYLEFLARVAGVADPLDETVVEAYWVGGPLVEAASPAELTGVLRERFAGQPGGTWGSAAGRARAHHSFHVFEVYPWVTLLRRTRSPAAVSVLDQCRIRTGVVAEVRGSRATVSARPLVWESGRLGYGAERTESVSWSVPEVAPGDRVALHWDRICDVLTAEQAAWIVGLEERQLDLLA